MGFNIRPGMSTWNSTSARYKKEYAIYVAKMEQRKFENDRKLMKRTLRDTVKNKPIKGINQDASEKEKQWLIWMEF